ncbi:unnamed protein product [Angiostrongylus costaricensis]|uniref:Protein-S-isoprenylcysteine O-methyltransferase n=1 Tax=Angiostrongylus costaricensis TaxID=334426 RepID=A0A0R3PKM5_ANGCS|nr:unnamed protein product [Angiostrongylus costaricensis]
MPVTWMSLCRQYRNDNDFRGSLNFFVISFAIAVVSWFFGVVMLFMAFVVCMLNAYFCGKYYGQKPIYALQATFLGLVYDFCLFYKTCFFNFSTMQPVLKLNGASTTLLFYWKASPLGIFCGYTFVLSLFHFSEFIVTAVSNRRSLQPDSFLLNHSAAYWIAAFASWTEFFLEVHFTPFLKVYAISGLGFIICMCGEVIRKLAMLHAGNGFTHRLALSKRPDHRLVTTGIYSYLRHPGYAGWFLWSIGTQIILCNPICLFSYAYITWHFFKERIYDEERDLIHFFVKREGGSAKEYVLNCQRCINDDQ